MKLIEVVLVVSAATLPISDTIVMADESRPAPVSMLISQHVPMIPLVHAST